MLGTCCAEENGSAERVVFSGGELVSHCNGGKTGTWPSIGITT